MGGSIYLPTQSGAQRERGGAGGDALGGGGGPVGQAGGGGGGGHAVQRAGPQRLHLLRHHGPEGAIRARASAFSRTSAAHTPTPPASATHSASMNDSRPAARANAPTTHGPKGATATRAPTRAWEEARQKYGWGGRRSERVGDNADGGPAGVPGRADANYINICFK